MPSHRSAPAHPALRRAGLSGLALAAAIPTALTGVPALAATSATSAAAPATMKPATAAGTASAQAGQATSGTAFAAAPAALTKTATKAAKTKLVLPLAAKSYRFTSPRGPRCMPTVGATTEHLGQDMGATNNAPIHAIADGTVVATHDGDSVNSGYIVIESVINGATYQVSYIHQWDGDKYYKVGQNVKAGAVIGLVGSSGPATGPHLHLEVWTGGFMRGTALYPLDFFKQRGLDIAAGATANYNQAPPKTCTYYARFDTPLRATASASSRIIAQLRKGDAVTSWPGAMNNKMLRIGAKGLTGYVAWNSMSPSYVAAEPVITYANNAAIKGDTYATTAALNLRSTPRTGTVKRVAAKGTKLVATGRTALSSTWYEVTASGQKLWASTSYLRKIAEATTAKATQKPSAPVTSTPQPAAKPSTGYANNAAIKGDTYATTAALNLRSTPRTGTVKRVAAKGTKLVATGRTALSSTWYEVTASGQKLWASTSYLRKVAEATPAKATKSAAKKTVKSAPKHSATVRHATANVWLRAAPLKGKTLQVIRKSTAVTLTGTAKKVGATTWYRVKVGNKTGWVSGAYLR